MKRKYHKSRGVTLVEVLIALLVLGISAFGMMSSVAFSKNLQWQAIEINTATKAAQVVLESMRKIPYIVLEEAVPPGTYTLNDVGTVYDSNGNKIMTVINPGLLHQTQSKLTELRLSESIIVEHANDAIRVTVKIRQTGGNQLPIAGMTAYIVKNGLNFR